MVCRFGSAPPTINVEFAVVSAADAVEEAGAAVPAGSLTALISFLLAFLLSCLISGDEAATAPDGSPDVEATSSPE
jgi:hypothetical protein